MAAGGAEAFESVHKIVDDLKKRAAQVQLGVMKCKMVLKMESATSRQNTEYVAVKRKAYVPITADTLLSVTCWTPNSNSLVHINIKCAVASVSI